MIDEKKLIEDIVNTPTKNQNEVVSYLCGSADRQNEIIDIINAQPKLNEWIPCSERMPEKDGDYLVWYFVDENRQGYEVSNFDTDMGENGEFGYWQDYYDNQTLGFLDSEWIEFETVVAWQPLPEPYEVKENGTYKAKD